MSIMLRCYKHYKHSAVMLACLLACLLAVNVNVTATASFVASAFHRDDFQQQHKPPQPQHQHQHQQHHASSEIFSQYYQAKQERERRSQLVLKLSTSSSNEEKNSKYIQGLTDNLSSCLDKYILRGSNTAKEQAQNIMTMIQQQAQDPELIKRANRMVRRAGLPAVAQSESSSSELGRTDSTQRQSEAERRRQWEEQRQLQQQREQEQSSSSSEQGRSALSRRLSSTSTSTRIGDNNPNDLFLNQVFSPAGANFYSESEMLKNEMGHSSSSGSTTQLPYSSPPPPSMPPSPQQQQQQQQQQSSIVQQRAISQVAQLVAQAGRALQDGPAALGIGGLDNVLAEVKRRVWTPLAAPPQLLQELGMSPVRGLLLYGRPGCGKTLLARRLGQILSPLRPITVVSGPQVLDKFVGSSEANLRQLFDEPPDIYDTYRLNQPDGGHAIAKAALHVIVMDEFDAIARTRGGRGGTGGDQGDAGVARDSVVNQLLAKMDGVEPLPVPTMVIGLTNKRSLIDSALLRAGRFEVQVEVPPPRTVEQRVSILKVHTRVMHQAGRILLSDAPTGSPATRRSEFLQHKLDQHQHFLFTYDELLRKIAAECDGFSGASLAAVTRAAASHALERAVNDFMYVATSPELQTPTMSINDCVVLWSDFEEAIQDVKAGMGDSDWGEDDGDNDAKDSQGNTTDKNIDDGETKPSTP